MGDINIALINELAMLFHRMGLDTREVLAAARTSRYQDRIEETAA